MLGNIHIFIKSLKLCIHFFCICNQAASLLLHYRICLCANIHFSLISIFQVASCCSEALLICQALLHPRLPTLHSQHQETTNSTENHQETDETQPSADLLSFMKSLDHLADKAGNIAASNDDEIVNISDSPMPSVVINDNAQVVEVSDNVVENGAAAEHGNDEDVISIDDDDDECSAGDLKDADDCVVIDEDTVSGSIVRKK